MSKAQIIRAFGGPDVLMWEDVAVPSPQEGQVLIRQTAVGLNFIDVYQRTGLYPQNLPFIPGNEGVGVVEAVGEGVSLQVGQRVAYATALGAYAEQRLVEAAKLVVLPDAMPDDVAAAVMLKGLTAQYLVKQTTALKAGHVVLVHAAAGGVGLLLCQWAKALGAFVIGTVGSEAKARLAKDHGCDVTLLYREQNIAQAVLDATQGQKCDVVYDSVGASTFEASLDSLKPRGLLVSYGNASGPVTGVNLGILAQKGSLYVTRPTLFGYANTSEALQAMSADVFAAVLSGVLKVTIGQTWDLADASAAHRALEARDTVGSSVLRVV